jgi:hypothetical protein
MSKGCNRSRQGGNRQARQGSQGIKVGEREDSVVPVKCLVGGRYTGFKVRVLVMKFGGKVRPNFVTEFELLHYKVMKFDRL